MANSTSLTGLSKNILREKYILEGFKIYLEALDPEYFKLLTESDNSDILLENKLTDFFNKVKDKVQKTRLADFFEGIALLSKEVPQIVSLLPKVAKEILDNNFSPKQVYSLLNKLRKEKSPTTEATNVAPASGNYTSDSDGKNFPVLVQVSQFPVAEKVWQKIVIAFAMLALVAKTFGPGITNKEVVKDATNKVTAGAMSKYTNLDGPPDDGSTYKINQNALDDLIKNKIKVPGAEKEGIDVIDDDGEVKTKVTKHFAAKSNYGEGTTFDDEGEKTTKEITKKIVDELKAGNIVKIQVAGTVSNTTGDDEKATDTGEKLTKARADHFKNTVLDGLKKSGLTDEQLKNLTIDVIKAAPSSEQVQNNPGERGGAGVFITFTTEGGETYKFNWEGWPEWGVWGVIDFTNPEGGDETPRTTGGSETARDITPIPPVAGDDFSKLNRNGQIATVLASIDPKLNIAQYKEIGPIKSYTDNELLNPNIKDEKAKELARLIVNIRKNPNSLLKKVSKATGLPFNVRAKAVSTRASKSTQAQLQSPTVKETQELFQEALVDDIFTKLGIQDSDLAKNKIKLAGYLGSMYAKEGDTDLSILDTDKLSDDDKKELQKVGFGFTPQSGNNYVFLKGRSAADVGAVRKIKPDVKRALDAVAQRKNELESYFNNIQNRKEFAGVIVGIIKYFEIRLQQDIAKLRGALQKLRTGNYIAEAINDPSSEIDVQKLIGRIEKNTFLVNALKNISDEQELIQFLAGMSTYVTKVKPADKKGAFQDAENVLILLSKQNKPTGGTGQTNEMQRMQELAGIKTR
jgi:hypothetical protein